eukprot:COSAG01_NODE_13853_length_1526_cov_7.963560_2_plen_32_part_01
MAAAAMLGAASRQHGSGSGSPTHHRRTIIFTN